MRLTTLWRTENRIRIHEVVILRNNDISATDVETEGVFVHSYSNTEVTWLTSRWGCHSTSYSGNDFILLGVFSSTYPEDTGKWCDWVDTYTAHFICEANI